MSLKNLEDLPGMRGDDMRANPKTGPDLPLDVKLLDGFAFRCRPGCGLCCYATPAVAPHEKPALVAIDKKTPFLQGENGYSRIGSRADGGACYFLKDSRCGCHRSRPFPCAEFPLSVHLGSRAQATLILSCPGVTLDRLGEWAGSKPPESPPSGLDEELEAVLSECERLPVGNWLTESARREQKLVKRLERQGLWTEPDELRSLFMEDLPLPSEDDYPPSSPPEEDEGLDALPLFFDEDHGRVALRGRREGWEALTLREEGGIGESIGVYALPADPPELDGAAESSLRGYLSYVLSRDSFIWTVYAELENHPDASLLEMVNAFICEVGAQVLARGSIRARMGGSSGESLSEKDVLSGIRATDADLMDQMTLGRVL
jgi:Fe-S-cluster containining protein